MEPVNPDPGVVASTDEDAELITRYLEYVRVAKRLAERTIILYTEDLHKLQRFAVGAHRGLLQVENHHIRGWIAQMHSKGRSARGIGLILSGWRGFYVWLGREGLIKSNPVQDVRPPKAGRPLPKALAVDETVQFADYHNDQAKPELEARDAAIVEMLYGSGLRVGELVGLDVQASDSAKGWIDLREGIAHVLGKGSKRRSVPVGAKALAALAEWLLWRANNPKNQTQTALFTSARGSRLTAQAVWQGLQKRSLQAGLDAPVHPHMLRHSFASHVLQSSGDLRGVQELLGHANITTTQVYTRLDFQHLAKVYDAAHPRAKRKN